MQIIIQPNGSAQCLYNENIDLTALGSLTIQRASHVEPDMNGNWFASMIDGPTLGPFKLRSEALKAEANWLLGNKLSRTG